MKGINFTICTDLQQFLLTFLHRECYIYITYNKYALKKNNINSYTLFQNMTYKLNMYGTIKNGIIVLFGAYIS